MYFAIKLQQTVQSKNKYFKVKNCIKKKPEENKLYKR